MVSLRIPTGCFFLDVFACSPLLLLAVPLRAQRPAGGPPAQSAGQRSSSAPASGQVMPVNVMVSVREPSGMPFAGSAFVKLTSVGGMHLIAATRDNSTATFQNMNV